MTAAQLRQRLVAGEKLIGPHDLSCSLGLPEQYDHPDFLAACETILRKARSAGLGAGIHFWGTVEQQARLIQLGANLLIHSADLTLFKKNLQAELRAIKHGRVGGPRSSPSGRYQPLTCRPVMTTNNRQTRISNRNHRTCR